MWYWHGMGFWGWLMMLAFWAVVIFLIVWAVRSSAPKQQDGGRARRILDDRLARGEIDRQEYEERREVLESHQ